MRRMIFMSIVSAFALFHSTQVRAASGHYASNDLITVAELADYQPIGVAVSAENRLFVGFPKRSGPYRYGLTEIIDGQAAPYPNAEWNRELRADDGHFINVQDLYVDHDDALWVLDSKPRTGPLASAGGAAQAGYFKLVKFDLKQNKVARIYHFDDLDKQRSALNDMRIDTERNLAYLSDPGRAALVVLDLATGKTRTVLQGSEATTATAALELVYEGKPMRNRDGQPFVSHVNGIALSKDQRYFYFKPINKLNLYRIATDALADTGLSETALLARVEDLGETRITHGLEADANDNIFLSSSMDYSIAYRTPEGAVKTLVQDSRIIWPDSFGIGSDGYLYFSAAQLNREAQWHGGQNRTEYPYSIYKVKLPK